MIQSAPNLIQNDPNLVEQVCQSIEKRIKLDSKGPVLYRQVRVGRHNKDFWIFKFRLMRVGADKGNLVTIGGHQ